MRSNADIKGRHGALESRNSSPVVGLTILSVQQQNTTISSAVSSTLAKLCIEALMNTVAGLRLLFS